MQLCDGSSIFRVFLTYNNLPEENLSPLFASVGYVGIKLHVSLILTSIQINLEGNVL